MKSLPFGVLMLLSLLVSAAVSFGITPIVKRVAYKVGAVDVPKDERRMHSVPIPRLGGLAIAIAFSADCGIICPGWGTNAGHSSGRRGHFGVGCFG